MRENEKYSEAYELIKKGYQYQRRGRISAAIRTYRKSLKILPTAEAHTFLGWAFSLQGRYDKAIEECYRAIDLDEEYGNPYNDLGYYFTIYKKYDEALEWLAKAINAPRYEERHLAYYNLGKIYELKGDWFKAVGYYYQSFQINPSFIEGSDATLRLQGVLN